MKLMKRVHAIAPDVAAPPVRHEPRDSSPELVGPCGDMDLPQLQQQDPYCRPLLEYKKSGTLPTDNKAATKVILEAEEYVLIDNVLHHLWYHSG